MKTVLTIVLIVISLAVFAALGLLLTIDYKSVEDEFTNLLSGGATAQVTVEEIKIKKFPLPKLVAKNVKIPGVIDIDEMVVNFDPLSIIKRNPRMTTIGLHKSRFNFNIAVAYENDKPSYGKANIQTAHIAEFLQEYPDLQNLIESAIPANSTSLIFDIVASKDYLTMTNLRAHSAVLDCTGEIAMARDEGLKSKLSLTCDKISLAEEQLGNVTISGTADKAGAHLESAKGNIASGGAFEISGDLTKNAYRSAFDGHLRFAHNDINVALKKLGAASLAAQEQVKTTIASDFKITPVEFNFDNLKSRIGSLSIDGAIDIKTIGDSPRVSVVFNVDGFNSGLGYPVITPTLKYLASLLQGTGDRAYIAKLAPIRNISYLGDYKLSLISPIIDDKHADHLILTGTVSTGKVIVDSFDYLEDENNVIGSLSLDTIAIKPTFSLYIKDGNWSTDSLSTDSLFAINSNVQNADLAKIACIIDLSLNSLTQGDLLLNNVKFKAKNVGNTLNVDNASFSLDKRDIQINGSLIFTSPLSASLAYVYNSFDLGNVMNILGSNMQLNGIANVVGVASTNGSTKEELLYHLYAKSKFIANKVDLNGFGIDDFVTKLTNLKYDQHSLNQDIKSALFTGTTSLHDITGNFVMDRGIISFKDISLGSKYTSARLAAGYNIYNQDLDVSSLWSFQFPINQNSTMPSSIALPFERKGGGVSSAPDLTTLAKAFEARAIQNMMLNPTAATINTISKTPPAVLPQPQGPQLPQDSQPNTQPGPQFGRKQLR